VMDKPLKNHHGPGRAYQPVLSEIIQFEFMRHWDRVLTTNN
jgi:PAH dioxygenase large subunit